MMVETHLHGTKLEAAHNDLSRHRWQPTLLDAYETGRGGNSGGHLFTVREGQSAYKRLEGTGFLANVLQRQQMELVLVSLYLKCGEDLNSQANSTILGQLAAFLQELATPWIVAGDFQVPPTQWEGHNLMNVLKAEVICTGQPPTMMSGAELGYLIVSRSVAPFINIKVNWDVPWKPHAALAVDKEAPRLTLPQVTQYSAVPKLDDQVRGWEDFQPSPKLFWLGRPTRPKEIQYAEWCHAHGLHEFQRGVEALIAGDPSPITLLIKGAECNKDFAKKLALDQQASDFQLWLSQAKLRGHSGIYKCLKAPDNVRQAFSGCSGPTKASLEGATMAWSLGHH